ncbi:MAG: hypothetical protein AAB875_01170 [Patescibacteria group bacterium]
MRKEIGVNIYVFKDIGPSWEHVRDPINLHLAGAEVVGVIEHLIDIGMLPVPDEDDYFFLDQIIVGEKSGLLPVIEVSGEIFLVDIPRRKKN